MSLHCASVVLNGILLPTGSQIIQTKSIVTWTEEEGHIEDEDMKKTVSSTSIPKLWYPLTHGRRRWVKMPLSDIPCT